MRAGSVALLWWAAIKRQSKRWEGKCRKACSTLALLTLWTATCPRSLAEVPYPAPNQSLSELQLLFPKSCKVQPPVGLPVLPLVSRPAKMLSFVAAAGSSSVDAK